MDDKEIENLDALLRSVQEWLFTIIFASIPQTGATMADAHAARHRLLRDVAAAIRAMKSKEGGK